MNRAAIACVPVFISLFSAFAWSQTTATSQPATAPASRPAASQPTPRVETGLSVELDGMTPEIARTFQKLAQAYLSAASYSDRFVVRLHLDMNRDNKPVQQTTASPGSIQRLMPNKLAIKTAFFSLYDNGTYLVVFDAGSKTYRQGLAPDQLTKLVNLNPNVSQVLTFSPHIGLLLSDDPAGVLLSGYVSIKQLKDETLPVSELGFKVAVDCQVFELKSETITTTLKIDKKTFLLRSVSTDLTRYFMGQLMSPHSDKIGLNVLAHKVCMEVDVLEVETGLTFVPDTFTFRPQEDDVLQPLDMPASERPEAEVPGMTDEELQNLLNPTETPAPRRGR